MKTCKCGERINPILGCYPTECAVCRLLKNFEGLGIARPAQTNCQIEPAYPEHDTVLFSFLYPSLVGHLPTLRCATQEPHNIEECKEFDR